MNERDIAYLSALELRDHYRSGDLSPVEVTGVILERIGRLNPTLNAYVTVTVERALEDARVAERAYRERTAGPLAGVPISIKDITPTRGIRTTMGSRLMQEWIPDEDAPFVEKVSAAGAVLLGKTNTPELGWKGDSGNRVIGPTHNPWKHGRTAGGSSGGASSALAAGLGPLASGTDGAGSIRIPAAFCGVFGLKPSFGLVPYYPPSSVEALAHIGPMSRTVRDSALLLDVVSGDDPRDRATWPNRDGFLLNCEGGVQGMRVAWSPDLGYAAIDPEVRAIAEAAAQRLTDLGAHVEEVSIPFPDPWNTVDTLWASAQAGRHVHDFDAVRDDIDPGRIPLIERGRTLTAVDLNLAYAQRTTVYNAWREWFEQGQWDLLLTPTLPITAFPAGDNAPAEINGVPVEYLSWTAFTYPFNLTGNPAATVPAGFASDGLPVGLQMVGRWRADATVLRAAAAYEDAFPWAQHTPPGLDLE